MTTETQKMKVPSASDVTPKLKTPNFPKDHRKVTIMSKYPATTGFGEDKIPRPGFTQLKLGLTGGAFYIDVEDSVASGLYEGHPYRCDIHLSMNVKKQTLAWFPISVTNFELDVD
jgi:hypothetical protein